MGMYTELYLGIELKSDMPNSLINWFKSHDDEAYDCVNVRNMAPKELQNTRLDTLRGGSFYFDAQQHYHFRYCDIGKSYFLTLILNIKNYSDEIDKFLEILKPYITSDGHIGHTRYEEEEKPTILYFDSHEKVLSKEN